MKRILVYVFLLTVAPFAYAHAEFTDIDEALKAAQSKQLPVFIDFSAIWCHSCHAMDDQVLNGADWDRRLERMVFVRSDADDEDGAAWMKKLNVPALPTYIVLNPDGSERGRLVGEIKRAEFYPALDRLLSGSDGMEQLKARATSGSIEAVIKVLDAYVERNEAPAGMKWYLTLSDSTRKAIDGDARAASHVRVAEMNADKSALRELMTQSQREKDKGKSAVDGRSARVAESCRTHAQQALAGTLSTDERLNVTRTLLWCGEGLSPAHKQSLARDQLMGLRTLYVMEVPNGGSGLLRDATHTLAQIYEILGDEANAKATYERAVDIGRKALDNGHGGLDVRRDRSMNLVLAEMMHYAGRKEQRLALNKAVAAAYPDDYHWSTEYGKDLLEAGKATEALPYLKRAKAKAVGKQQLNTAYHYAKALVALNRRAEAEKVYDEALRQGDKAFPEYTAIIRKMRKL